MTEDIQSKACSSCKEVMPLSAFSVAPSYKDGRRGQCRKCRAANQMAYKKRPGFRPSPRVNRVPDDPSKTRERKLRRKYGISPEMYAAMFALQEGACAICQRHEQEGRRLAVDHCHLTGIVRGLLCYRCNIGLGHFEDNAESLQAAAKYVGGALGSPAMTGESVVADRWTSP